MHVQGHIDNHHLDVNTPGLILSCFLVLRSTHPCSWCHLKLRMFGMEGVRGRREEPDLSCKISVRLPQARAFAAMVSRRDTSNDQTPQLNCKPLGPLAGQKGAEFRPEVEGQSQSFGIRQISFWRLTIPV